MSDYNYKSVVLADHKSAQCHVDQFDNGDIRFVSYITNVIYYSKRLDRLYCTGTYSQTTRKQIGWFLREYFPAVSYQEMKNCAEHALTLDCCFMFCRKMTEQERKIIDEVGRYNNVSLYPSDFEEVDKL